MPPLLLPFNLRLTVPRAMPSPFMWSQAFSALKLSMHQTHRMSSKVSIRRLSATSMDVLKSNPNTTDTTTIPTTKRIWRRIRTLDPSKLVEADYVDLSLLRQPLVGVLLQSGGSSNPSIPRRGSGSADFIGRPSWSSGKFPAGTHGFLYYHIPPYSSPLAGELRFRITPSRDPASFAAGSDLFTERDNMPWRYPLYKLVHRARYRDLVTLLLQDGLVSQSTLDLVTAAFASSPLQATVNTNSARHGAGAAAAVSESDAAVRHPTNLLATPVLSAFGQEFRVSLRYSTENFLGIFASSDAIVTYCIRFLTASRVLVQGKHIAYCPFKGNVPPFRELVLELA